ncbi:hypothetical protein ABZ499_32945 [Streptomyces sp. NPDC019990]|uniref:hypothetical protein n=1 Tax=Streptomyces sp. NPDC019990 TaxID=3154693 RepID=UPI0033F43D03
MSATTITATITEPAVRVTTPLPELPDLGTCGDCGLELVCLTDSDVVFCERCDLGISPTRRPAGRH